MDKQQSNNGNFISAGEHILDFKTNMMLKKIRWLGLVLGLIAFLINGIFISLDYEGYVKFIELNFSYDGFISSPEKAIIEIQIAIIVIFVLWIIITSKSSIESLYKSSIFNRFLYFFTFMLFISYFPLQKLYPHLSYLYMEDGFFESLTAVFAIISSLLCLISIYYNNDYMPIKLILFALFFLFGMEEISWGQRIFGWNTPEVLLTINYQNETTIHNILNPYFQLLYPPFNLLLGFLILSSMKWRKKVAAWFKMEKYLHFIPSYEFKLYGFIFVLLSLQSYFDYGELTEEIFSVFILAYAANLVSREANAVMSDK